MLKELKSNASVEQVSCAPRRQQTRNFDNLSATTTDQSADRYVESEEKEQEGEESLALRICKSRDPE